MSCNLSGNISCDSCTWDSLFRWGRRNTIYYGLAYKGVSIVPLKHTDFSTYHHNTFIIKHLRLIRVQVACFNRMAIYG